MNPFHSLPVFFIMGPTASGKTALAIELCQRFPMEVVSVDSAMIYRSMDIGTAKPDSRELALAPHHLIDFLDPKENYSVAQFRDDALASIKKLHAQNKIPLLVGGTMLYHRSLLYGLSDLPSSDPGVREKLQQQLKKSGLQQMHQYLYEVDSIAAAKIHPNDPQRIIRALEVYQISGKPLSQLQKQAEDHVIPYPHKKIVIAPDNRELLRERIKIRFYQMLEQGFVEEVRQLYQRGDLSPDLSSMRSVGYRQVWEYLQGDVDYDSMVENAITATRQFAKRQMTWLRRENNALWLNTGEAKAVDKLIDYVQDDVLLLQ